MNKTIIVIYLNVAGKARSRAKEVIANYRNKFVDTDDIIHYILPVRDQPTKVECINPRFLTEKEYKEIADRIDVYTKKLELIKTENTK